MTTPEPPPQPSDGSVIDVRPIASSDDLAAAATWLEGAEAAAGIPLVDEAERDRLTRATDGARPRDWQAFLLGANDQPVGYAAVALPLGDVDHVAGDLAVATDHPQLAPATIRSQGLIALRAAAHELAPERRSVQVWMRHVHDRHLADLDADGFEVARRLGILGRDLGDRVVVPTVDGVTVRPYRSDQDDAAVVDVLAQAYAGTGDGGWTVERFAGKRELAWFRAEDLLLADASDPDEAQAAGPGHRILGLHWLKRRGEGVGEVYNLAIHPAGQGRGVGALLLAAGLAHLREVGCHDVLLWVDRSNERAVELYTSRGFTTRWDDVALEAPLAG